MRPRQACHPDITRHSARRVAAGAAWHTYRRRVDFACDLRTQLRPQVPNTYDAHTYINGAKHATAIEGATEGSAARNIQGPQVSREPAANHMEGASKGLSCSQSFRTAGVRDPQLITSYPPSRFGGGAYLMHIGIIAEASTGGQHRDLANRSHS